MRGKKKTGPAPSPNLKVGDRVRLFKATRHNMLPAGAEGEVVEIRRDGTPAEGVTVRFLRKPHPYVAKLFGDDPDNEQPFLCLFPLDRLTFAVIG